MYTVFYKDGHVIEISPNVNDDLYECRDLIYSATSIVSDGIAYDLNNPKSITSIEIPNFKNQAANSSPVFSLDYILRMHANLLWQSNEPHLALSLLRKASQLMLFSNIAWQKRDYYRIVSWFEEIGKFEKAEEWRRWIEYNVNSIDDIISTASKSVLEKCTALGTDLVLLTWSWCESNVAAKYCGRVYSISGEDRRFPNLPDFIKKQGMVHPGLGNGGMISPYLYSGKKSLDKIFYQDKKIHVIKASWRDFVDDRTPDQVHHYEKVLKEEQAAKERDIRRSVYNRLLVLLPNDMPKSFSSFTKLVNSESAKYQSIIKKAEQLGYIIPSMKVPIVRPVDPEPLYEGGKRKPFFL